MYILPKVKTIQHTGWWSCGVSCAEMILEYYGKRGDWKEESLVALRVDQSNQHIGSCLEQLIDI